MLRNNAVLYRLPYFLHLRWRFLYMSSFIGLLYIIYLEYNHNVRVIHKNDRETRLELQQPTEITNSSVSVFFNKTSRQELGKETSQGLAGCLNVHIWQFACDLSLEKLFQYPLFPVAPHAQTVASTLRLSPSINVTEHVSGLKTVARRIFGFVRAPSCGRYMFSLSAGGAAELWLSKDQNWENVELVCAIGKRNETFQAGNSPPRFTECSSDVLLEDGILHYVELLHVGSNNLNILWKPSHSENFEDIQSASMFSFTKEQLSFKELIKTVPLTRTTESFQDNYTKVLAKESVLENDKDFFTSGKYLPSSEVSLALPACSYKPGYVGKRSRYQYEILEKFVNPSYVYPEIQHHKIKDGKWVPWFPLSQRDAVHITREYLRHLQRSYPWNYQLKKILNVERKPDWSKNNPVFFQGDLKTGDRYLLELELWDGTREDVVILSEYIYQESGSGRLCYPEGLQWNRTSPVYFLMSVRGKGQWVWHFIKNMERIYLTTKDENLHVIIYGYDDVASDHEEELKKSSFKNYQILKSTGGTYSKTFSLNRAAAAVTDPDAIIFTLDLHLEIPATLPNNVRKHCIKGKMVYTPIICRLACGASPLQPSGEWDPWGYGMFGGYKSDWDRFQGFDEKRFGSKWGGEDWDIVERAYKVGLEFERIKKADFYHYDHSKEGMW